MSEIYPENDHDPTRAHVEAVFEEYHKHVHCSPENEVRLRHDIAKTLNDFAGEYSNDVMYGIAELIDIADMQ